MFPIIIALLALGHLGEAQFRPFRSCNITQLENCHGYFMSLLGAATPWYDFKNVRKTVEGAYARGAIYGLQRVCHTFGDFKRCFSPSGSAEEYAAYQACTEQPIGLLMDENKEQRTYTKAQALGYVKFVAQFDFACGAGLGVFAAEDTCMADVFATNTTDLEFCQDLFDYYMKTDEYNICIHQMTAARCYRQQFARCSVQAGWFGCEYERTGTAAMYSQCTQNFCTADTHDE